MKPIPPTVRALDADGSEFFLDSRGLAFRADSSRVPELDGPPAERDLMICPTCDGNTYVGDIGMGNERYCPTCRGAGTVNSVPPAPTLDRGEVARVLADAFRRDRRMQCATEFAIASNRLDARCDAYEEIADSLGIRSEFDALTRGGGA